MPSTIATEHLDGSTYATWEQDGRGLRVSDVYLTDAESEDVARITFTTMRLRSLAERIDADGSIGGERLG